MFKKNLIALVLTFTFIFPAFVSAQTATKAKSPARNAAETITAKQLKEYLIFRRIGRDGRTRHAFARTRSDGANLWV